MPFGFDPSIILSSIQRENPNDDARTLMQLLGSGVQRQTQQATLADMLRKQQQTQTLADIYRQNADAPGALPSALMRGGFGQESYAAQDQAAQTAQTAVRLKELRMNLLRNRIASARTPDDYAQGIRGFSPEALDEAGLGQTFDAAALQRFVASGIPAEKQPDFEESQRRRAALADPTSPTSQLRTQVAGDFGAQLAPGTPGNAVDDKELELLERGATAKELARLRYGPGAIGGYSQEAIDAMALRALRTGEVQNYGPGATGAALRQAVFNRMAELSAMPGAQPTTVPTRRGAPSGAIPPPRAVPDLATANAEWEANKGSLKEGVTAADATDVNEGKALADIKVFESKMDKVFNSNSKWLNATGRVLQENAGNPDVSAFLTARTALVAQVTKVLNTANPSDSARHEAEELLKKDASVAQYKAVLDVLKQDMARSKDATHARVKAARDRISGKPEAGAEPQDAAPPHGQRVKQGASWFQWNPKTKQYEPEAVSARP